MKVKEVAELIGISVRTLHHYDEIGLLSPKRKAESGYREYTDEDLETLQQILFFRELGFPLKKIKDVLNSPSFDRQEALLLQKKMLLEKRSRLDQMILLIERTIQHAEGEIQMTNKEKFEGFDFSQNPYEKEARERWGNKAVDRSNAKLAGMSGEEQEAMTEKMNAIYRKLAALRKEAPSSDEAHSAIKEWYDFLNDNFGSYSFEVFKGLGQMYVSDERFTKNIDQFGEGLAKFMCEAMAAFADKKEIERRSDLGD
ncbi:MerR family transcriptional regulator [Siminovitchia terrae]|uniref:MerR family transcriptional regulator n=1 Tax=Siminovitchia terrae TaxID=1914933 RepID=UPI0028A9AC67|nr:MerR family transcriptional regulator [Siminovitchia terrae]